MAYAIPKLPASPREAEPETRPDAVTEPNAGRQHVAWLQLHPEKRGFDPYRYVLLLRFTLLNLFGFGLLGAAYAHGLVHEALQADRTYLSVVIFLVFLVGLGLSAFKVWQTSHELNSVRDFDARGRLPGRPLPRAHDRQRRGQPRQPGGRAAHEDRPPHGRGAPHRQQSGAAGAHRYRGRLHHRAGRCRSRSTAADVKAIAPMVSTLIQGMSTALYTTLIGAVLNVWLMANHQILAGGTVKLITAIVELAEIHARD